MAGMSTGGRGQPQAEPNVVPMIDILLVLLIIFMISQPLSRMALDVQVPPQETSETPPETNAKQIVLQLTETGGYEINGQPIPKDQLEEQIRQIFAQRNRKLMFIDAAQNRIYQDVVEAMDLARGAGVQVIGFTPQEAN